MKLFFALLVLAAVIVLAIVAVTLSIECVTSGGTWIPTAFPNKCIK